MIRKRTVVVVGAGASNDLGLPLGPGLKNRVADLIEKHSETRDYLLQACRQRFSDNSGEITNQVFKRAAQQLDALKSAASIDNFLDQRRNDKEFIAFSKMNIAYAIAEAEQKSSIRKQSTALPGKLIRENSEYFLLDFLNIVARNHQEETIIESLKNITFIIFNYDRCVERYFSLWLTMQFGHAKNALLEGPEFLHVYGSLGDYFDGNVHNPFQYEGRMAFQNPHFELPAYVDRIKLFTEQEDSDVSEKIRSRVNSAEAIIFLGFGFEEQNMRFFERKVRTPIPVFATQFGMSPSNEDFIDKELAARFAKGQLDFVRSTNGKSRALITDHYHSLTRAVGSV